MTGYSQPRVLPCGETAVSVEFGDAIDRSINRRVQNLFRRLKALGHPGVLSLNPTYRSLCIQYDPWECSFEQLLLVVQEQLAAANDAAAGGAHRVEIPVCYGGELGPDLDDVAEYHGCRPEEVIRLHAEPSYLVYMVGFTPGFPYLGELDERLRTPRRKDPRVKVPPGSVAIADRQTGIYPLESPGGWHLIGRTPLRLFDWRRPEPFRLSPGDEVFFKPITRDEFERFEDRQRRVALDRPGSGPL